MTAVKRQPIIGGNWKMNTTVGEAEALAIELVGSLEDPCPVDVVVCPPFTHLQAVKGIIGRTEIRLGAQDLFWEARGAFTGEVSAEMLVSVGASWVICGHSERRHLLGETDEIVNRKARRALETELAVILAVGETEGERAAGDTEAVLERQLTGSLADVDDVSLDRVVIAYEPVWAIGTGLTATPAQAQGAHTFIRTWLARAYDAAVAETVRIQYGGSVNAANAAEILSQPDVDGALVGGASLKAQDFAAIVKAAATGQ